MTNSVIFGITLEILIAQHVMLFTEQEVLIPDRQLFLLQTRSL